MRHALKRIPFEPVALDGIREKLPGKLQSLGNCRVRQFLFRQRFPESLRVGSRDRSQRLALSEVLEQGTLGLSPSRKGRRFHVLAAGNVAVHKLAQGCGLARFDQSHPSQLAGQFVGYFAHPLQRRRFHRNTAALGHGKRLDV
ncbi:MAG TPA: hypothetical protein VJL29_02810 [Thermoguttaceae bacterium]|nr:hypothetical protein [Thermoguttaceae bacterium]